EKSNINDFIDGKEFFENRWKNKNLIVYPGILRIDNENGTAIACSAMNKWESANYLYELNEKGIFKTDIYPKIRLAKNCCATRLNSYIIGPRGEIYKCWNDVSDDEKIIGYINQEKLTNPALLYRYIVGSKWYVNSECKECFFLPICNGNCAWYALKNIYNKGEYIICDCLQKSPEMLNKSLEYQYDMMHK
ncbi:SPASM domain-containing protein, partial [Parabacteroides sp. OttesenSCG-928-J18]|nr:SPASM domain-containing protein [Parabacteroides sp. OttesenSCG-928-J18]